MLRDGEGTRHFTFTPDGPKGPRRKSQFGLVYLASRSGLPIVPVGFGYSRSVGKFDSPIGTKADNLIGISLTVPLPFWNNNDAKVGEAQANRQRILDLVARQLNAMLSRTEPCR